MANASSNLLLNPPLRRAQGGRRIVCAATPPRVRPDAIRGRRQCLLLLTASTAVSATTIAPALAENIPLFGIRQKLRKAEKETEEILRKGEQVAEEGLEAAEKGIETAKQGIETAEKEIVAAEEVVESSLSFGGLAQAGVVLGAELRISKLAEENKKEIGKSRKNSWSPSTFWLMESHL
ncbi:hypothetical protein H6P81_012957 [Aristolochia fimbriata]|uniref:Uncharacterized protein n=1 Tax=Aristolochia fimbriata TaxID=158543 RepID=A0AAV7EEW3_ARIFI|nr:hypothetical protein H6P81_012957 [Aristolochia fimbriata]